MHGVAALCVATFIGATEADWRVSRDDPHLRVEKRERAGAKVDELRITLETDISPAQLFAVLWNQPDYPGTVPYVSAVKILRDTGDERVAYVQISAPLVTDRDYTVRYVRRMDLAAQRYVVDFDIVNDQGPPPNDDFIRMQVVNGSWTLGPLPSGGTRMVYQVLSDPGGSVPGFLARRGNADASVAFMEALIDKAKRAGKNP